MPESSSTKVSCWRLKTSPRKTRPKRGQTWRGEGRRPRVLMWLALPPTDWTGVMLFFCLQGTHIVVIVIPMFCVSRWFHMPVNVL